MTEPGTKTQSSSSVFSVRSGTLSNCVWDPWLLVSLVISGLFVLYFQFNLLNPSLSQLTFTLSHPGDPASVLCFEDK